MSKHNRSNGCLSAIRKFFLSAFVVISFIAYALERKLSVPVTGADAPALSAPTAVNTAVPPTSVFTTVPLTAPPTAPSAVPPTPTAASNPSTGYKNGTYTGPSVDVNWGFVQVQATIQNGKISDVQVVQYPNERRTSLSINSVAVPMLQQEAIQAQSANVDLISGATLTSEGFQESLQTALDQARG